MTVSRPLVPDLRRRAAAGSVAFLVGAALLAAPATSGAASQAASGVDAARAASAPEAVRVKDAAHDVRVFRRMRGLTPAQRRSVDLRTVWVTPRDGTTRFTVRLRKVLRSRDFDQAIFLVFAPARGSSATWSGSIGMSPQRAGLSYAGLDHGNGTDYESCDPLRATVLRRTHRVSVDVPTQCLPEGEVTVTVTALTGYFRSDMARPWSQDRLRFPAPVVLR